MDHEQPKQFAKEQNWKTYTIIPDLKLTTKLQSLKQCGTGTKTDIQTNGIEYRFQK